MSNQHIHAEYRGHDPRLDGKFALVIVDGQDPTKCKAQFDDLTLPTEFNHGWKEFPTNHFNIRPSQLVEHWEVQGRNVEEAPRKLTRAEVAQNQEESERRNAGRGNQSGWTP